MGEKRKYIDINEMIRDYLPMSRKKARKFVLSYLNTKRIGNKIYVDREELEQILANAQRKLTGTYYTSYSQT